jgi:Ni/Co efflux regulator RcnB
MKYMLPAAAVAVCLGSALAFAQTDTDRTTTTMTSPSGDSQTTTSTTKSNDGYAQYRRTITTTKHYQDGAFVGPTGYVYSRYELGATMPRELLTDDSLVLKRYSAYDLKAPPSGLSWIRVGDDALLVDRNSGEVVETDYDLFRN